MAAPEKEVRQKTVDALAKGLYEEAHKYGLRKHEIIRFVNTLLQLSMQERTERLATEATRPPILTDNATFPLVAGDIGIRPCVPDQDEALLRRWLEDPDGQHFIRYRLTARTITTTQLLDTSRHVLGIIMQNQNPIGCMAYLDYDRVQQKAELRKMIGEPTMRHKGFAKRATRLWIAYGLEGLGLQKIYLNTLSNNIRNIRINEELGFSVEGILRNEVFLDGKHHDIIRMGLCNA